MTPFSGVVWRILFAEYADDPLSPARAPAGTFTTLADDVIPCQGADG